MTVGTSGTELLRCQRWSTTDRHRQLLGDRLHVSQTSFSVFNVSAPTP